eukprot:TRINITY_DN2891_c0_g1_i1.p1 TRINITY_DN2891_c0_g1~~TRINITY_DN2891_c0_g1_i1.p1  ORF type:complete len:80 (-),score=4.95 TRINITY_DN2891_c0_g1_i1:200-439(-)
MIDIDEDVVNECRKHMPGLNAGAFENPMLELIIGDGIDYVKNVPTKPSTLSSSTPQTPSQTASVKFFSLRTSTVIAAEC